MSKSDNEKTYYTDYGMTKIKDKGFLNVQLLHKLLKPPTKEKWNEINKQYNFVENDTHQMDLMTMPEDDGFKYLLLICDVATNKVDGKPLKTKDSKNVLDNVLEIYKNSKYLKTPKNIQVDDGSEFKGEFSKYFNSKSIFIRVAQPGRHRQQSLIEKKNSIFSKSMMAKMLAKELLTSEPNKEWIKGLNVLIDNYNKNRSHEPLNIDDVKNPNEIRKKDLVNPFDYNKIHRKINSDDDLNKPFFNPKLKKSSIIPVLNENDKVRVKLMHPIDNITGKRLHGPNFRNGDIRWSKSIHEQKLFLNPIQRPMYGITGHKRVLYNFKELQPVDKDEMHPKGEIVFDEKDLQDKSKKFVIEKFLDKFKENKKWKLKVKWLGFDKPTIEDYDFIKKQQPDLVKKYEEENLL